MLINTPFPHRQAICALLCPLVMSRKKLAGVQQASDVPDIVIMKAIRAAVNLFHVNKSHKVIWELFNPRSFITLITLK